MNIWIINPYALPPTEDGSTRHYSISKELVNKGHKVYLICSNIHYLTRKQILGHSGMELLNSVIFVWVESSEYRRNSVDRLWNNIQFSYKLMFSKQIRNLPRPDIIVGSSPHLFGCWVAQHLARSFNVPFVFEVRDLWPQSLLDLAGISPRHPIVRLFAYIEKYLYKHADSIITLLPYASNYIKAQGVSCDKISWIPNGIDLNLVPKVSNGSEDYVFKVFYIGSHGIGDGLDLLLDAAAILNKDKGTPICFTLIGHGPEKEKLKTKARNLNLNNVIFEDPVPKAEVYNRIAEADAFILLAINSNLYKWGLSFNKFYDYMAMARPIIFVGDIKDNPINKYTMGVIIPTLDANELAIGIRRLSEMGSYQRYKMGLEGRKYVEEKHDYARLAGKFEKILKESTTKYGR